ncbi:D-alanine--D-alanine ligase [Parasegetibacter sp. NRK P23]|uniref:D-alanine--D-alanine ligase n=1 Tax=Parasegetibacter sp. NRK P23 TaxID=2942999 RepID=UPI00204478E2|nr:D-alanine--D-alanine ligase [Parasegetibacter sp. NRK P23]MCM5528844.1 D-alanine--D-alanine ligase [Parasegetibacter sp. NRK P23]
MKPVIAFVTGGYSGEAVVSYKSAITIEQNLDPEKYEVYRINITPEEWFHPTADGGKIPVDKSDFTLTIAGKKIRFNGVFIGIHGTPGEDGKLQGYFDLMGLPYTSCDAAVSALTFNKRYTVAVAAFGGIRVAKSLHLFKAQPLSSAQVLAQLKLPVFVKPNNGGSSIGMSKVNLPEELAPAIEKAFKEDAQVLVEEFITGREFTIGVYRSKGAIHVLPITEVKSKKEFFDFEAKYTPGLAMETTPAEIDAALQSQLEMNAKKVYELFNCRGVVRMDFIYEPEIKEPFLLEINTVPGQSEASIVPQQVRASGGTLKDFYSALLDECLA